MKHSELYVEYEKESEIVEQDKGKGKAVSRKVSLIEAAEQVRLWDINDPRAQQIHWRVTEMMALDSQPFSLVDDPGCTRLVHELEPRYSLPSTSHKLFYLKLIMKRRLP